MAQLVNRWAGIHIGVDYAAYREYLAYLEWTQEAFEQQQHSSGVTSILVRDGCRVFRLPESKEQLATYHVQAVVCGDLPSQEWKHYLIERLRERYLNDGGIVPIIGFFEF